MTSRGPDFYPYVRSIGGVSLFDFHQFDPPGYAVEFRISNWQTFVPCREEWGGAVWIEIDRARMQASKPFIPGDLIRLRWYFEGESLQHIFMPRIEAAYIGPLPTTAFKKIIFVFSEDGPFHEFDWHEFDRAAYEKLLEDWKASRKGGALK